MDKSEIEKWEMFRGQPNSTEVLQKKSEVLAKLIIMSANLGFEVAQMIHESTPQITLNVEQAHRSKLEGIAFGLRVTDELASRHLQDAMRVQFMTFVHENISKVFCNDILFPEQFDQFIKERYEDYAVYDKWVLSQEDIPGAALFWEFSKRQAHILGIGKDAIYNQMLTTLLLEQIVRWGINNLLSE